MSFLIANTKHFCHHRISGIYDHDPSQHEVLGILDNKARDSARDMFTAMTTISSVNERLTTRDLAGVATTLQHCKLALERLPHAKLDLLADQAPSIRAKTSSAVSANTARNQAGIPAKVTGVCT